MERGKRMEDRWQTNKKEGNKWQKWLKKGKERTENIRTNRNKIRENRKRRKKGRQGIGLQKGELIKRKKSEEAAKEKNSQKKEHETMNKRTENKKTYCTIDWPNVRWHCASIRWNLLPMIILITKQAWINVLKHRVHSLQVRVCSSSTLNHPAVYFLHTQIYCWQN
jgi:hypothetical protein